MYCSKCGTENSEDAIYCKKCGALLEAEDETRVATKMRNVPPVGALDERGAGTLSQQRNAALSETREQEKKIFSITPTVKFVYLGYLLTIVAAFVLVALVSIFLPVVGSVPAVIVGVALLMIPAYYHIKKKLVRYTLTDTTIEIDRGLISRTTQNIPLRRVQDVTVSATVIQRLLGYGDIEIDNASDDNTRIILDDIDAPKRYADMILKQMRLLER